MVGFFFLVGIFVNKISFSLSICFWQLRHHYNSFRSSLVVISLPLFPLFTSVIVDLGGVRGSGRSLLNRAAFAFWLLFDDHVLDLRRVGRLGGGAVLHLDAGDHRVLGRRAAVRLVGRVRGAHRLLDRRAILLQQLAARIGRLRRRYRFALPDQLDYLVRLLGEVAVRPERIVPTAVRTAEQKKTNRKLD